MKMESLEQAILSELTQVVEKEREYAIKHAVADFEERLRESLGKTVVNLANCYSVERLGPNLLITVKIGETR